jgi:hypothetical protein
VEVPRITCKNSKRYQTPLADLTAYNPVGWYYRGFTLRLAGQSAPRRTNASSR